jgi:hypothetical protein
MIKVVWDINKQRSSPVVSKHGKYVQHVRTKISSSIYSYIYDFLSMNKGYIPAGLQVAYDYLVC